MPHSKPQLVFQVASAPNYQRQNPVENMSRTCFFQVGSHVETWLMPTKHIGDGWANSHPVCSFTGSIGLSLRLVLRICWSHPFSHGDAQKCRAQANGASPFWRTHQSIRSSDREARCSGSLKKVDSGATWIGISALPASDCVSLVGYLILSFFIC